MSLTNLLTNGLSRKDNSYKLLNLIISDGSAVNSFLCKANDLRFLKYAIEAGKT